MKFKYIILPILIIIEIFLWVLDTHVYSGWYRLNKDISELPETCNIIK